MYTIDEGQLTLPEQWKDETVNVLTSGTGKEPTFSLVITRDEIAEGMAFSDYVKMEPVSRMRRLDKRQRNPTFLTINGGMRPFSVYTIKHHVHNRRRTINSP